MAYDHVYSIMDLANKDPKELINVLSRDFGVEVPDRLYTTDDMEDAAKLLSRLSNEYSFLLELLSLIKVLCREAKRSEDKRLYEDTVDKKEIVSNKVDAVKNQYQAISRMVTIHIENMSELKMMGER